MASSGLNRSQLAATVVGILESSKVNLGRKTKARTELLDQVRKAILGSPRANRDDCMVRPNRDKPSNTKLLVGPGGAVQMTGAESQRAVGR